MEEGIVGVVKFLKDKEFGFIKSEAYNQDIYFHKSNVKNGINSIREGSQVVFSLKANKDGKLRGKNIEVINESNQNRSESPSADELNEKNMFLPDDTANLLEADIKIDNYHLQLNKTAFFEGHKFTFYSKDVRGKKIDRFNTNFSSLNYKEIKISERMKASLEKMGLECKTYSYKTDWRLAIGLGGATVYDTSMTLHHIYGVPFIPASAIKGILRSWFIMAYFNNDEVVALKDEGFCFIFGSPQGEAGDLKGAIQFFDAFPEEAPKITRDIMTPHYKNYYDKGSKSSPTDDQNPVPISFLTIENTSFEFIIAGNSIDNRVINFGKLSNQNVLELISTNLIEALRDHGIGAKTAVGYGRMTEVSTGNPIIRNK